MTKQVFTIAALLLVLTACNQEKSKTVSLDSATARFSYAQGLDQGKRLKGMELDADEEAYIQGVRDGWQGGESKLSKGAIDSARMEVSKAMQAKQLKKMAPLIEKGKAAEKVFFEKNKKNKDVHVTASGLQYIILKEGKGDKPAKTDKVSVHYVGTLLDGTEFDNSIKRGQPVNFPVNRVVPGWTEVLQLMSKGSKWKVFIPYTLAYGEMGRGAKIPPASTLIFEMELLDIIK